MWAQEEDCFKAQRFRLPFRMRKSQVQATHLNQGFDYWSIPLKLGWSLIFFLMLLSCVQGISIFLFQHLICRVAKTSWRLINMLHLLSFLPFTSSSCNVPLGKWICSKLLPSQFFVSDIMNKRDHQINASLYALRSDSWYYDRLSSFRILLSEIYQVKYFFLITD